MMKVAFKKKVATLGWSTCQMHTEEGTTGTWLKSPNCLQSSWIATTDLQNTIDQPKTEPSVYSETTQQTYIDKRNLLETDILSL